jgi:reactive intermediate/imine deaminase
MTMAKEIINPPTVAAPTGYSHAVKKSGTPVFIAGQVATDASGKVVGEGDIAAQAEQVLTNLKAVVEGCGGSVSDIVKITVFVTDLAYRPAVAAARQKFFTDGEYPASTFLVVSSLATPAFLIEIEAVAMIES